MDSSKGAGEAGRRFFASTFYRNSSSTKSICISRLPLFNFLELANCRRKVFVSVKIIYGVAESTFMLLYYAT